ncbi:rhamnulokinase [Muricomes sp. OA1]|uniref:Rhamnulokinase n=1 Tax=Hungatella hathewayi TaxID=154046 RepID=A0A3E2WVH8_9FIRM|nr:MULTISPECIES: rhamnulokinase [Clostridia]MCH1973363.1 rhamnulokinase [Muricomes sp. OA1]RGC31606.1 rhamnulokinase [Hungatella hathewayi]GKH32217.1 rhamnulokinase [Faecalicatena contorta]
MIRYYLAVDIGASSGRHMLGWLENGKMQIQEVHRFQNGMKEINGSLCWDVDQLFKEVIAGLKKCREMGKIPESMGIDTWGNDFVLLDEDGRRIGNAVGYRDARTNGMDKEVYREISEEELYARTGIQKLMFNTVYQLMALKMQYPDNLQQADTLLLMPDYLHYLLTGIKAAEYTNATTTQLVNAKTKDWDRELIARLGYPGKIFQQIRTPGTRLGKFSREICELVGFECEVVLPATHDTGSAVLAVPSHEDRTMYISSGTWSLMGVERMDADCSPGSRRLNFTNEGGYEYRFRYLKNIMGLWMIQSVKKELQDAYSFAELCTLAEKSGISTIVDCNALEFLAPESMMKAIYAQCKKQSSISEAGELPQTPGDYARVIYRSLARCYQDTVKELENQMGCEYGQLHVVGGGSNAAYLNQLTAEATGKKVLAGPAEATAIGNLMVQMLEKKVWKSLRDARECVYKSFDVQEFSPGKGGTSPIA